MNTNNDNILVIHPKDDTTDFLSVIYKDINATVIRQHCSKSRLKQLMNDADRIIMLGHGTGSGMGFVDKYGFNFIIDSTLVYLLKEKKDNIYIWCHADEFVKKYKLSGFTTGMFISEYEEACMYGVKPDEKKIEKSNNDFARIMSEYVHKSGGEIKEAVKNYYYDEDSEVVMYNNKRIYNLKG